MNNAVDKVASLVGAGILLSCMLVLVGCEVQEAPKDPIPTYTPRQECLIEHTRLDRRPSNLDYWAEHCPKLLDKQPSQ